MRDRDFEGDVRRQVALLDAGRPLEAFDQYFSKDGVMYSNGTVFAEGAVEGRRKQEPHIASATSISGRIVDLVISEPFEICAFRNLTSFVGPDGDKHQIDGVCWQRWRNGKIVEERYFHGDEMRRCLDDGILRAPERFG